MKLILLVFIAACIAPCQDTAALACNLKVFQPDERRQHQKLTHEIMATVVAGRELAQGYEFQIDTARVSLIEVAEWVGREKKCCPFFDFQITLDGGPEGKVRLALTGRAGVKQFVVEEFRALLPVTI